MNKQNEKICRNIVTFDVYVGHVPKNINQDKLRSVFSRYGEILDVFCRHSNNLLGYAIIKFKNKKDVDRLLKEVDKVHVDGYEMEVKIGVKNNQSAENGEGAHGKTVTFSEPVTYIPPPQMGNACMIDPNLEIMDGKFMSCAQNQMNGQKMQTVEVICTHVDSPVTFHGCLVYKYDELQTLAQKLNSICRNLMRLNRKPLINRVYGALFDNGHNWYRCTVCQVITGNAGMCIVKYIDYGNMAEVCYSNMVDLPEPFQKHCPLAVKCILTNLMCNPNYRNDVAYLHHLVNKRMSLTAVCTFSDWGVPEYQVYKCSSNGIDVINEIVKNGHAMYRTQQPSRSSPAFHNPENPGCSKSQVRQKPKKSNTCKANPKKIPVKTLCNGVEKSEGKSVGNERMNSAVSNDVKCPKTCSPDNSEHSEDFVPKRIIKRGDISDVPELERSKAVKDLLTVDSTLTNLKLVNNIRNLVSFPADGHMIKKAVDISLNEVTDTVSQDQKILLESSYKKYTEAFNEVKECTDQTLLADLKEKRDHEKNELLAVLKQFLESFDCSLLGKKEEIQKLITDLESNSNAWMYVQISSLPDTIEELVAEYNKESDSMWSIIRKARENTNEKHKKFIEFLGDFAQEFSLNMLDGNSNSSCHLEKNGGKRGSYAVKFQESLSNLGMALEEEIKASSGTKGKNYASVSKCIVEKLDAPKEKIESECNLYLNYKSLYDDLKNTLDLSSIFEELSAVQKNIQTLTADCGDDKERLKNRLVELHSDLLLEDKLLGKLVKISDLHYPELILEHPELNLYGLKSNSNLLKSNWHISYFPVLQSCSRLEPAYISKIIEDLIIIKEFNVGPEEEKEAVIKKAIVWNEIESKSLVKIQALFSKDDIGVCAIFPQVWETLYENPLPVPVNFRLACNIIQQVLKGLVDIHEKGMAHGAVHPLAVLHKGGKVLLDFNYDKKFVQDNICLKGINFQDPSGGDIYKSTDMYEFGCLVLWILFPNLLFTSTENGVPNINAFQSIIQELLSDNDFKHLSDLLKSNHHLRPTSKDLKMKGFLKVLRILTK